MSKRKEVRPSICLWCEGECGVIIHARASRLVAVEPDPDWPWHVRRFVSGCIRRRAAQEYLYHPARLNFPLKRIGERGEGRWQRLRWEDALDEIAAEVDRIKTRYGPEAVATVGKNALPQDEFRLKFSSLFGSSLVHEGSTADLGVRRRAARAITGMLPGPSVRPTTRCIVLLGSEPLVSRPTVAQNMLEALKQGAILIVIDPRRTRAVTRANVWLPLRPGTDAAVLLSMARLIIDERLYDPDFVNGWCDGLAELKGYLDPYTPEWAAAVTGVPAEKIKAAARLYALNKPAAFVEGRGVTTRKDAGSVLYWRWVLAAITGNLDVIGGEELYEPQEKDPVVDHQQGGKANIALSWGVSRLCRSIINGDPHLVRGLIVQGQNPLVTWPGTRLVYKALKKLDLFVAMDTFYTSSVALADYVLPAACWLERPDVWYTFNQGVYLSIKPAVLLKAVPGKYERYYDFDLWRGLGIRLGQGENWPWNTLEELYTARLALLGFDLTDRRRILLVPYRERKYLGRGFATPTGRIEICSPAFTEAPDEWLLCNVNSINVDSIVVQSAPEETGNYPLTLITGGRVCLYHCSEWRQVPSVRRRHHYPVVELHPEVAKQFGIGDGDWVWLETVWGRVRQQVKVSESLGPRIVCAELGWWLPELPGEEPCLHGIWEFNANACLTDGRPDGVPCRIVKASPPTHAVALRYPMNTKSTADGAG